MTNELITINAKNLIKLYNRVNGTHCKVQNEENLKVYEAALRQGLENGNERIFWDLTEHIKAHKGMKVREVIESFNGQTQSSEATAKATAPEVTEAKTENTSDIVSELKSELAKMKDELKSSQENSQMGLLERTLAEVIVKTQGEQIKNELMGNFEKQAEDFMLKNYGTVHKKIEVEVGQVTTEFNEVLHKKFDTVLKFVQMDEPVFLTGQAGTGKNVLCKQVAKALNLDFYFSNAVTQEYKLTGFIDANGNYQETQFYKAFKNGGLFMLDEMDASIPEVLVILNAAIANRYFDFPTGYVEAHPDFRVIAAGNTFGLGADYDYVGRNQLDMASLDRFALVEIDYDEEIEKSVAEGDTELVEFVRELRTVAKNNGIRLIISYRAIGRIAKMQKSLSLGETLQTCLFKNLRKDDISVLMDGVTTNVCNKYTRTSERLAA